MAILDTIIKGEHPTFGAAVKAGFASSPRGQQQVLTESRLATDKARQASFERQNRTQPITLDGLNKTLSNIDGIIQQTELSFSDAERLTEPSEEDLAGLQRLKGLRDAITGQIGDFFSFDPRKDTNTGKVLGEGVKETLPDAITRADAPVRPRTALGAIGPPVSLASPEVQARESQSKPKSQGILSKIGSVLSSPTLTRPLLPSRPIGTRPQKKTKKLSEMTIDELRAERKRLSNGNSN